MFSWLLDAVGAGERTPADWAEVSLCIYEMPGASKLHSLTKTAGLGAAHHIGVSVYWLEWSFGWCSEGPGVYMVHPGENSLGIFKSSISLGKTTRTPQEVIAILEEMRADWPGTEYHLLNRSCAHFSVELAQRLNVQNLPDWLSTLASVGDHVVERLGHSGTNRVLAEVTPEPDRRLPPEMAQFGDCGYGELSECDQRELTWKQACAYVLEHEEAAADGRPWEDLQVELRWESAEAYASEAIQDAAELVSSGFLEPIATASAASALRIEQSAVEFLGARVAPPCRIRLTLRAQTEAHDGEEASRRPSPQVFAKRFQQRFQQEVAGEIGPEGEIQVVVRQGQTPLGKGRSGHAGGLDARLARLGHQPLGDVRLSEDEGYHHISMAAKKQLHVMTNTGPAGRVLLPSRRSVF